MTAALAAVAFVPGLAIGSFLNVVAARVPLKRSIVSPGSACMSCGQEVAWYDNVPVLSFVLLRGRCRGCGTPIGWVYPAVEVLTAVLVAGCFLAFGWSATAFVAALFCATLVTVSATDLSHRIIPDVVVLPATAVVLVAMTALHPSPEWLLGAFGASLFLFLAVLAHPKGMGMGDVKLALLMGAMLGRTVPVGLMVGMIVALLPSVVLFARYGMAARKMKIPFGPFLAFGGVVALFFGDVLLDTYLAIYQ
jgi:leader peptidase (prepilin peptidase) / N-methyltransferase